MQDENYGTNGARHYSPYVAYALGIDNKYIYFGSHCVSKPHQYISEIIAHSGNKVSAACNRKEITREECLQRIEVLDVWEFSTAEEALAKEADLVIKGKRYLGEVCMNTLIGSNKHFSVPEEHRKFLSERLKSKEISPERMAFYVECGRRGGSLSSRSNRKRIQQYKGDFLVAEYKSIREASASTGLDHSNITKAAKGKHKQCGGFLWRYATP